MEPVRKRKRTPLGGAFIFYLVLLLVGFLYATYVKVGATNKDRVTPIKKLVKDTCQNDAILFDKPRVTFDDELLVVVFKEASYDEIPFYEALYRPFYPSILYCCPRETVEGSAAKPNVDMVFYDQASTRLAYQCVQLAWTKYKKTKVKAFLFTASDVAMMPASMARYDRDKIWFWKADNITVGYSDKKTQCVGKKCVPAVWDVFQSKALTHQISDAMNEVVQGTPDTKADLCCNNLKKLTGGCTNPLGVKTDVFHIPGEYMDTVTNLLKVYLKHKVPAEVAVATVLSCVAPQSEILPLAMTRDVNAKHRPNMKEPWKWVDPKMADAGIPIFHQPHQLSYVKGRDAKHVLFFCKYVSFLHDPLTVQSFKYE